MIESMNLRTDQFIKSGQRENRLEKKMNTGEERIKDMMFITLEAQELGRKGKKLREYMKKP